MSDTRYADVPVAITADTIFIGHRQGDRPGGI